MCVTDATGDRKNKRSDSGCGGVTVANATKGNWEKSKKEGVGGEGRRSVCERGEGMVDCL